MSVEHAKAFIEKMKTDEAFHDKIMAIETPEDRLNAIIAAGFDCSVEELNESRSGVWKGVSGGRMDGGAGGNKGGYDCGNMFMGKCN